MEPFLQERAHDCRELTLLCARTNKSMQTTWNAQEIHVMHPYKSDFYGQPLKAVVLGYIRPELDYTSRGMHLVALNGNRV
jgi:hypothetical protein